MNLKKPLSKSSPKRLSDWRLLGIPSIFIIALLFTLSGRAFDHTSLGPFSLPLILRQAELFSSPVTGRLVIHEVLYDPVGQEPEAEWISLFNAGGLPVDLDQIKVGDEESRGQSEGMLRFPAKNSLEAGKILIIANCATIFEQIYNGKPDFEMRECDLQTPNLIKYSAWAGGSISLSNTGDEVLLLDGDDHVLDALSWGNSIFAFYPSVSKACEGCSLKRKLSYVDTDQAADWQEQTVPAPWEINFSLPPTPTDPATPTAAQTPPESSPTFTYTPTKSPTPLPTTTPISLLSPTPTNTPLASTASPSPVPTDNTPMPPTALLSEILYDPNGVNPDAEWIELYNPGSMEMDISRYRLGDEETKNQGEGMAKFPQGSVIPAGGVIIVANKASDFYSVYQFKPDYELNGTDSEVPDLLPYPEWADGVINLANMGDEVLLMNAEDMLIDSVSWGNSTWAFDPAASDVATGHSLERYPAHQDTNQASDWIDQTAPNPGQITHGQENLAILNFLTRLVFAWPGRLTGPSLVPGGSP